LFSFRELIRCRKNVFEIHIVKRNELMKRIHLPSLNPFFRIYTYIESNESYMKKMFPFVFVFRFQEKKLVGTIVLIGLCISNVMRSIVRVVRRVPIVNFNVVSMLNFLLLRRIKKVGVYASIKILRKEIS